MFSETAPRHFPLKYSGGQGRGGERMLAGSNILGGVEGVISPK